MSRLLKFVVDNALIAENSKLNILVLGEVTDFVKSLAMNSNHNYFVTSELDQAYKNLFSIDINNVLIRMSLHFNLIVSTSPLETSHDSEVYSSQLKLPLLFLFNKRVHLAKPKTIQAGIAFSNYKITTTDKTITDELHLYDAILNTEKWDKYFYEFLAASR